MSRLLLRVWRQKRSGGTTRLSCRTSWLKRNLLRMSIKRDLIMLTANAHASESKIQHSALAWRPSYNCCMSDSIYLKGKPLPSPNVKSSQNPSRSNRTSTSKLNKSSAPCGGFDKPENGSMPLVCCSSPDGIGVIWNGFAKVACC